MNQQSVGAVVMREGFHQTYPHCNGFADGGRSVVLGRVDGNVASLWKVLVEGLGETKICEFDVSGEMEKLLWFDVALEANRLVTIAGGRVWLFNLNTPGKGEVVYESSSGCEFSSGLSGISVDGRRIVFGLRGKDGYAACGVDVATGTESVLFEKPWFMSHLHFCPFDEEWMGFCHEGACEQIGDRVWGWHATEATQGRCLFDQHWGDPERELSVGHERWKFHEPGAVVVGYGASRGKPRGIYEVNISRRSRLISEGERDLHVNISRDGRWIVVDTSGPHDRPGKGWEDVNGVSDILLIDAASGARRWLARTRLGARHPYHPHPCFSPDGRHIYFNEAPGEDCGGRVMRIANPEISESE